MTTDVVATEESLGKYYIVLRTTSCQHLLKRLVPFSVYRNAGTIRCNSPHYIHSFIYSFMMHTSVW